MGNGIALVTGATGAIGPSLVNRLLKEGYTVRSYGLDEPEPDLFVNQIEHFTGDINNETQLSRALTGVDIVFHLAALLHIENPGPELASEYHHVNVDGSRTVAEQAAQAGVRRLVYFSTVKVYGIRQREPVTEDYPTRPQTLYAQTKLAGEKAIRTVDGIEACVLRLSAVYGPRLKGSWNRLVKAIEGGRFLPVGNLQNVHSLTFVDDVAWAALLAAQHPDANNQIYNVVGFETPTMQDVLGAIYTATGRRMPAVRIPAHVALFSFFVLDRGFKLLGKRPPLTSDAVRQLTEHEVYSGSKLRQLGFNPTSSLVESWRQAIDTVHK